MTVSEAIKIDFDSLEHKYSFGGKVISSVTQIMQAVGMIDTRFFVEFDATRGTYVHKAVNLYERGLLDFDTLDEHTRPYIDQYLAFKVDTDFQMLFGEQIVYYKTEEKIIYCGTYDLIGILNGDVVLIDIKTNSTPKWAGIQTWAYLQAHKSMANRDAIPTKRFALTLKPDRYQLKAFTGDFYDSQVWNAAVTVHNYAKYN